MGETDPPAETVEPDDQESYSDSSKSATGAYGVTNRVASCPQAFVADGRQEIALAIFALRLLSSPLARRIDSRHRALLPDCR